VWRQSENRYSHLKLAAPAYVSTADVGESLNVFFEFFHRRRGTEEIPVAIDKEQTVMSNALAPNE
jgi:hypothetical protein